MKHKKKIKRNGLNLTHTYSKNNSKESKPFLRKKGEKKKI